MGKFYAARQKVYVNLLKGNGQPESHLVVGYNGVTAEDEQTYYYAMIHSAIDDSLVTPSEYAAELESRFPVRYLKDGKQEPVQSFTEVPMDAKATSLVLAEMKARVV